jgi:cytochrome P450
MTTTTTTSTDAPARSSKLVTEVSVDPRLLAAIGKVGAPESAPKLPRPPVALPGAIDPFKSAVNVIGYLRNGISHAAKVREQHGDFYRSAMGGLPMVVVWDADEIHKILKNEDRLWSTAMGWNAAMFDGLDPRGGNTGALVTLDFDEHRAARKLVQPAFTLSAIQSYLKVAERAFGSAIPQWTARGHVDFKPEVRTLLAGVAGEIFTGIRDPQKVAVVDRALTAFWFALLALSRNSWTSPTFRKARKGLATLIQTFLALVPERRKTGGEDLFSRMCTNDDTDGLGDEEIVRVFITIMFGAFDTTSAGLTSMAYLLAKHQDWQDRLRDEARAMGPSREALDVPAMKTMKHHEWAWKETLRLMPVNGYVPRCALRDVEIGGHMLAAGTLVMPMTGGIGRHPKWWTNPNEFDPSRFSPERAEDRRHPGIFNPFGGGAHACVGMQLANMEMKLFWHRLLTTCRLRLAPDYEARHTFSPLGIVSGKVRLTLEPLRD